MVSVIRRCVVAGMALGLAACATTSPAPSLGEGWRATLVTAASAPRLGEVRGVGDMFTFAGKIYAQVTLVPPPAAKTAPTYANITFKWFNGKTLRHEQSGPQTIVRAPYYIVQAVPGTLLGQGRCRVEVHAGNELLAQREFTVMERLPIAPLPLREAPQPKTMWAI